MSLQRDWSAVSINEMKSLRFAEFGLPSVLRIEEVPIPKPGEAEALVYLKTAAINPSDIVNVAGTSRKQLCHEPRPRVLAASRISPRPFSCP
jgi:NADPH:quinone reductase-like Zn-dependent oxidoreductase